jgi:hypothetical protein
MAKVEARAGKPFLVWLKELEAAGNDMAVGDMYYVAWCGFSEPEPEPELTLEEVEKLPLPVIQAIFMGPVLEALYGYGEASKN